MNKEAEIKVDQLNPLILIQLNPLILISNNAIIFEIREAANKSILRTAKFHCVLCFSLSFLYKCGSIYFASVPSAGTHTI